MMGNTGTVLAALVQPWRLPRRLLPLYILRPLLFSALMGFAGAAVADAWVPAASLNDARNQYTATVLPNGKVLVAGGADAFGFSLSRAELYDPVSDTWTETGSLLAARAGAAAFLLANGKVLVMGGNQDGAGPLTTGELYDPASGTWSGGLGFGANAPPSTLTMLANGKVLLTGGLVCEQERREALPIRASIKEVSCRAIVSSAFAELFDPIANTVSSLPDLLTARNMHSATLLANGKVLVAGGVDINSNSIASAELYDPVANTWSPAGSLGTARHSHTAILLAEGNVLVVGGVDQNSNLLASAELYDPATNTWLPAASRAHARFGGTVTLLSDGRVLAAGGEDAAITPLMFAQPAAPAVNIFGDAELYDPASNTWSAAPSLAHARAIDTASLLTNGAVLVTGGVSQYLGQPPPDPRNFNQNTAQVTVNLASSEIFIPASRATTAVMPQTGIWWNPAEGGRGFDIEFNGSRLYMEAYMYDASGKPIWYVAGPSQLTGSTFSAPLNLYADGQTLTDTYQPPVAQPSPGTISITFSDPSHGTLSWPGGSIPIQRYVFATNGLTMPPTATQPQNGWWWNPAEGGRGFFLETQAGETYITGSMYDSTGSAVWYGSGPTQLVGNAYVGNWVSYAGGQTLTGPYKPPSATTAAGSLTIQFASPTSGTLTLPDGRQIPLQRYSF